MTQKTASARLILHEPSRQLVTGMDVSSDSTLTSLKSWKDSIGFARKIASLFDHWQFSYSAYADPVISCALWHAYCGLRLYGMSGLDESVSSFSSSAAISLEKLRLSLESFTPWWPIARVLRGKHTVFTVCFWFHESPVHNSSLQSYTRHLMTITVVETRVNSHVIQIRFKPSRHAVGLSSISASLSI